MLALSGEEPFWARAYERAAGMLERLDVDLAVLIDAGRLPQLPGVGRGLAAVDAAAATSRVAIEINGDPYRLDLEPRLIRAALARGLRFVVSTDAHSVADLANHRYGVAMARRGWVRRDDVLNTLEA